MIHPEPGPLLPILRPAAWARRDEVVCEPLYVDDADDGDVPWVAYGEDQGVAWSFRKRAALDGTREEDIAREARTNLERRSVVWDVLPQRLHEREVPVLAASGDTGGAAILHPLALKDAAARLGTASLIVGVPRTDLALVTTSDLSAEELRRFSVWVKSQHDRAPKGTEVSRSVFRVEEGRVVSSVSMPSAPPPPEPGPRGPSPLADLEPLRATGRPYAAEWWLAWSHLRSKKGEAFLSLVTVLSILGVVSGVAILNWVIGVMTGFEVDLRNKILGANAHVITRRHTGFLVDAERVADAVEAVPGVRAAAPFVYGEMMIRTPGHEGGGVVLKGIDPERHAAVTALFDTLDQGVDGPIETYEQRLAVFASLKDPLPAPATDPEGRALDGIVIGRELATILDVRPGGVVTVVNPIGGGVGPMGVPTPSVAQFRVAATYHSGMYEYDTKWTYVHNETAQDLMKLGEAWSGLEVSLDDIDDADAVADEIDRALGFPFYSVHWMETHAKLFEALRLEKWVMGLILSMIVFVAALLIVTTLIMLVITKGREIAILKAMGASRGTILRIFVLEGSLIGGVGTLVGTVLGLAGCLFLRWYGYPLETDVYYLSELPVVIDPSNVATIAAVALAICFVATLYPAYKASSLDPVEGLRYE